MYRKKIISFVRSFENFRLSTKFPWNNSFEISLIFLKDYFIPYIFFFFIPPSSKVIDDLNKRLENPRLDVEPLEGVAWTYGFPAPYLKKIITYWRTKYNWTERQSLLNKYPQFVTNIQGTVRVTWRLLFFFFCKKKDKNKKRFVFDFLKDDL